MEADLGIVAWTLPPAFCGVNCCGPVRVDPTSGSWPSSRIEHMDKDMASVPNIEYGSQPFSSLGSAGHCQLGDAPRELAVVKAGRPLFASRLLHAVLQAWHHSMCESRPACFFFLVIKSGLDAALRWMCWRQRSVAVLPHASSFPSRCRFVRERPSQLELSFGSVLLK